jgi:hypothetical protein
MGWGLALDEILPHHVEGTVQANFSEREQRQNAWKSQFSWADWTLANIRG